MRDDAGGELGFTACSCMLVILGFTDPPSVGKEPCLGGIIKPKRGGGAFLWPSEFQSRRMRQAERRPPSHRTWDPSHETLLTR